MQPDKHPWEQMDGQFRDQPDIMANCRLALIGTVHHPWSTWSICQESEIPQSGNYVPGGVLLTPNGRGWDDVTFDLADQVYVAWAVIYEDSGPRTILYTHRVGMNIPCLGSLKIGDLRFRV